MSTDDKTKKTTIPSKDGFKSCPTGTPCALYVDSDCPCLDFSGVKYYLLDADFLEAMNKNMNGGNQKEGREPNDWKELDMSGFYGRLFAIERHLKAYRKTRELRHLAAIGCNAMICFWLQKNKGM